MAKAKPKKKMTPAQKAAARVPEPAPVPKPPAAPPTKKERRRRFAFMIGGILLVIVIGFAIFVNDYSRATDTALEALVPTEQVAVDEESGWIAFGDPDAEVGYVFYPGGKVAPEAYAPLMHELADAGLFCVVAKMPFNLAFFDNDAADDILAAYPDVGAWYVGGHSLGGVAACQWAADNEDRTAGIILLASYPAVDLSQSSLRMLRIDGSEDKVMNVDNRVESQALQPADVEVVEIEGGNHAQFGDYGEQAGDGTATISAEEQQAQTVRAILTWIDEAA